MIKMLLLAMALAVFCRWALGKWPWDYLRPAPTRQQAVFRARKLLGVEAGASQAAVREAHRRMAALTHPDRGGNHARMQELNAARDLLLNEMPHETTEPPR